MKEKEPSLEEDEIDLIELFKTLSKYKILLLFFTLFITLLAGIYAFTTTKWYKAQVTISIGKQLVKTKNGLETKYFLSSNRLQHMLDVIYDTSGKYRKKGVSAYIGKVEVPRRNIKGLITITAYGKSNKEAVSKIKNPIDYIMNKDKVYVVSIISESKRKIDALARQESYIKTFQIPNLKEKIQKNKNYISQKEKSVGKLKNNLTYAIIKNTSLAAIETMQISNLESEIAHLSIKIIGYQFQIDSLANTIHNLEAQISNLKSSIQPPYLVKTSIVGKIYTKDYPAKPKKKLIVVVAFISGLILSIFLVFLIEFWKQNKDRLKEKKH